MKKKILTLIQIILVLVIIYSAYNIGTYYYGRYKAQKEFDQFTDIVQQESGEEDFQTNQITSSAEFAENKEEKDKASTLAIQKFKGISKDLYAYINIPDLDIHLPVAHRDNDYYLRRNIYGDYSHPGTLFIEEKNNPNFTDKNTIIYGHHMTSERYRSASMFRPILQYSNDDFFNKRDKHFIEILTEQGVKLYQVFSAYYVDASYDYRSIDMGDEAWVEYLKKLESNSDFNYKWDQDFKATDKILTLSTCDSIDDDGRYTVHAILIEE